MPVLDETCAAAKAHLTVQEAQWHSAAQTTQKKEKQVHDYQQRLGALGQTISKAQRNLADHHAQNDRAGNSLGRHAA